MPLIPRARSISESSTVSVKEDKEESSDQADKKSSQNTIQREKLGNMKENAKVEGSFSSHMVVQSWESGLLWGPLLSCLTTVTVRGVNLHPTDHRTAPLSSRAQGLAGSAGSAQSPPTTHPPLEMKTRLTARTLR